MANYGSITKLSQFKPYGRFLSKRTLSEGELPTGKKWVTQPVRRRKAKVYPQQKPVALPASMELSSFLFLAAAAIVVVVAAFIYLQVQSGITQMKNDVIALQSEIAETKQENEDTYQKIMDSVDLSQVYEIATGELGMIQPVDNQVYKYDNKKSDMVKQYGDIPGSSK